ncbi:MAG: hypothetical protein ACYCT7_08295 [bacterium]
MLSKDEEIIINLIYEYFNLHSKWPEVWYIKKQLGNGNVEKFNEIQRLINPISPLFIITIYERCELTFYGLLLCDKAKEDIDLIKKYISFLKNKGYTKRELIKLVDIKNVLYLSASQLRRLTVLFDVYNQLYGGGTTEGIYPPSDYTLDKIILAKNPEEFLESYIQEEKEKQITYIKSRRPIINKLQLFFWISFFFNIFFMGVIIHLIHPTILYYKPVKGIILEIIILSILFSWLKIYEVIIKKEINFISSKNILEHGFIKIWIFIILIIANVILLLF